MYGVEDIIMAPPIEMDQLEVYKMHETPAVRSWVVQDYLHVPKQDLIEQHMTGLGPISIL